MKTKRLISLFSVTLVALLLCVIPFISACAQPSPPPSQPSAPATTAPTSPLKIGVLTPLTGPYSMWGPAFKNSIELAFSMENNVIAGRQVQLIFEDEGGEDVSVALQKAKKLAESDKVEIIMGPFFATSAFSCMPYTSSIPMVELKWSEPSSDKQELGNPYAFWASPMYQSTTHPLGAYAYDKGLRTVTSIGSDYACGYDFLQGFSDSFTAKGGQVVQKQWAPIGETDYSPYLSNLKMADALICTVLPPPGKMALYKQYNDLGLFKKMPIYNSEPGSLTPDLMKEMGDPIVGIIGMEKYVTTIDNPENKIFLPAYQAKYNSTPDTKACDAYVGAKVLIAALKSTKGVAKADVLKPALLKVEIQVPTGPFKFSPGRIGMTVLNVCQITKEGGNIDWKILQPAPPEAPYLTTYP